MDNRQKTDLKGLDSSEITEFFNSLKLPNFRAKQLIHWIYERAAKKIDEITVFSKSLRDELRRIAYISNIEQINVLRSTDGSEKFLFILEDGNFIESILMPDEDRLTLCISTQIGCAMGCRFCRTASIGFIRNLYAHEIVDQVISVARSKTRPTNIVFMGMGEPLMNINEVTNAINRLVSWMAFSPRRITLSTVGIVKRLESLYDCIPPVNLAISLNAPDNLLRDYLMPINKCNPVESLMQTLKTLPIKKGRRITFEYVLLKDINDTINHAENLYKILKGIPCKINLIPFNSYEGAVFERPLDDVILAFQDYLIGKGLTVFIRKSRGADILGACGQLVGSYTNRLE